MSDLRKTTQYLLPIEKEEQKSGYDIYPVHDLGDGKIFSDYLSLAKKMSGYRTVVIDGYVGVRFDIIVKELGKAFASIGLSPLWWNVGAALRPETEIDEMIKPYLGGDDPIFGFRAPFHIEDYFDSEKLSSLIPDDTAPLNIIYGTGASLAGWDGLLVYVDIPKNEIQFRARAASITNLGASQPDAPKKMYKRFYFVDWVVLNRHKKSLLPEIDVFVDGQRETEITWAEGTDIRRGLDEMACSGFRVRPWFEPGAWGGQWIKDHIKSLARDVPNYAWSFELIVPENGLIFSSDRKMLEVSFDSVMYEAGEKVVGGECYDACGDEFPIRMDYLDNFDGHNLSIQCHPHKDYIQKNFGEVLTQEETYYILDTCKDAVVYLGFQDDIVPSEFEKALTDSFKNATPLDVPKYINAEPAHKHDLFLIPPGTLHSSGRNNLVLEISTTPYIFTFKMYDWLNMDLDGKPRPLNIRRAMENLCFDRKGEKIRKEHVCHPVLMEKGTDWELWHMPTHPKHSYDVHRYKIGTEVSVNTEGKCHVLNLVEGETADVVTENGKTFHLSYAETLVISAAAGSYRIVNTSGREIMMVKAFMK
ncbi:MAG: class I mannose-6-phosphate isomerase [Bacteroidetes bacterium]|uniref:Class I mannose-6-phosphate isomerase n=1 Tax=Candidatus Cryptobacteroides avicola TaxID=2840757 RepID=A0A940DSM0_9BACT|nr:class I mannose-6-phosphate isomerase [Candidatus Cryptobacteroides avicola]